MLEMSLSRAWVMWRLEVGLKTMSELVALCQADVAHVTVIVDELDERGRSCRNPATPQPRNHTTTGRGPCSAPLRFRARALARAQ